MHHFYKLEILGGGGKGEILTAVHQTVKSMEAVNLKNFMVPFSKFYDNMDANNF